MSGNRVSTPFADAVLRLTGGDSPEVDVVSFHALPWSNGASLAGAGPIRDKYHSLFGDRFLASEMTYTGSFLDSLFRPTGPLDAAQRLAATAFGSDYTFFITCGTTMANQVAMDALDGPERRLLVDRTAHHSIHLAASRASAHTDYAPHTVLSDTDHAVLDVSGMLDRLAEAYRAGRPYDAVVLAGSSYDGVLYDVPSIIRDCRAACPATTTFFVDEAWSAIHTFHPDFRRLGGLAAARRLATGERVGVLVTHSAHKSMSAARQGSYLHVAGDTDLVDRVRTCLYGRHSTSPSIPILASLDLARAHAEVEGARLFQRSIELVDRVRRAVSDDPVLASAYTIVQHPAFDADHQHYVAADPTKVIIDVSRLEISGEQARLRLFTDHRIYVARTVPQGILLNFHIGIDETRVLRLLAALRSMARLSGNGRGVRTSAAPIAVGSTVERLVIAYPPGVPIAVPGDLWTVEHQRRVDSLHHEGVDIYLLPVPAKGRTRGLPDHVRPQAARPPVE